MLNVFQKLTLTLCSCTLFCQFVSAAGLNDTGITGFANGATGPTLTTEPTDYPGQDAAFGRDAAARAGTLTKIGGGDAGFDFTKIANNGSELPATATLGSGATDWACTRDNVTGLMWEVKTDDNGLRDKNWNYSWYSSDSSTNGGDAGTVSGGTCYTAGRCDTEKYVADVNAVGLCGYHDWRLPDRFELRSIVHFGKYNPAIDTNLSYGSGAAWHVFFYAGNAHNYNKYNANFVRLARARQ